MANVTARPILWAMSRTWESYVHVAMFAAAVAVILALLAW
jgi:hypothetical protein